MFMSIGCTDAAAHRLGALGGSAEVRCYSGGKLTYEGVSTGRVASSTSSDGYIFVDRKDRKLREVSGDCVITYK